MSPRLVIVGNPECRRVAFWQAAATRLGWSPPFVVLYPELLTGQAELRDYLAPGTVVRFETAAERWETFKLLLRHGAVPALAEGYPALDEDEIDRLVYDRGWLVRPRQAHLGFMRLLDALEAHVVACEANLMHSAEDIEVLFDKPRCQERLASGGVPVPDSDGTARNYAEVRAHLRRRNRLMVKLAHGSGAAGCVALHACNGRVRALTTVAEIAVQGEPRLYHSKQVRQLLDESAIAALIDRLCVEKIQVEQWLPKARWEGRNFDLRVVTIDGVPRHSLVRSSSSIFTNLTLGSRRGELAALGDRVEAAIWPGVQQTCAAVARLFPSCLTLGIDVLVRPGLSRHDVLEVNAFGDLLLHVLDQGQDTYTAALAAWQSKRSARPVALEIVS